MAMVMGRMRWRAVGAGGGQDDQNGLGSVGHRGQGVQREGRQAFDRGDLLGGRLSDRKCGSLAGSA